MQQRIVRLICLDLCTRQIGSRHIRPRMTIEPHSAQMQEGGLAVHPNIIRRFFRRCIGRMKVQPIALKILQARTGRHRGLDPASRCLGRNPDAIVLTDEKQRQRHALHRGPASRIDRALRGGVVCRGIAKATHGDCIARQYCVLRTIAPCHADGMRRAHRFGQVAGNGRGLRRNHQRARAQHLVPPAAGRILSRTGETQEHIAQHVLPLGLIGAGDLERRITVVQEGDVIDPQRRRHPRHAFVPGRADGVKPLPLFLHHAALQVERAAQDLRAVEPLQCGTIKRLFVGGGNGKIPRRDATEEVFMNDGNAVHGASWNRN